MFNVGDAVKINHDGSVGAVVGINTVGTVTQYLVIVNGKKMTFFEEQLSSADILGENVVYSAKEVNALLTARLIINPSISSLYSLNSAKINYIPYQFRPVLKIVKSDSPRLLIADGVGVGKTIEAGLVLKELEARFDIKSVLVICPRPLITEKKWQDELKRFGERFVHIDAKQLRYCIEETDLDGEWPSDYQKCIIPYSLFDETVVYGTTENGTKKLNRKSLADLKPFPKFDLVIIDEAHHIKNTKTYAYQAAQMFCDNAESIVFLTATPIQLGDKDLFVLLNLLRPDLVFDIDSFRHMAAPNPFINEAAKIVRSNQADWQAAALSQLQQAGDTPWGVAMLTNNPVYQNAVRMLNRESVTPEQRVKLITDIESLHTFANIINRTRRRDIGNFTLRKPETRKTLADTLQYNSKGFIPLLERKISDNDWFTRFYEQLNSVQNLHSYKEKFTEIKILKCSDGQLHSADEGLFIRSDYCPKQIKDPIYVELNISAPKNTLETATAFLKYLGVRVMTQEIDIMSDIEKDVVSSDDVVIKLLEVLEQYEKTKRVEQFKESAFILAKRFYDDGKLYRVKACQCCWSDDVAFFYLSEPDVGRHVSVRLFVLELVSAYLPSELAGAHFVHTL